MTDNRASTLPDSFLESLPDSTPQSLKYLRWGGSVNECENETLYEIVRTRSNNGAETIKAVKVDLEALAQNGNLMVNGFQLQQPRKQGDELPWFKESILDHLHTQSPLDVVSTS
jgi:hypothetical protein